MLPLTRSLTPFINHMIRPPNIKPKPNRKQKSPRQNKSIQNHTPKPYPAAPNFFKTFITYQHRP